MREDESSIKCLFVSVAKTQTARTHAPNCVRRNLNSLDRPAWNCFTIIWRITHLLQQCRLSELLWKVQVVGRVQLLLGGRLV